ncbi:MAG: ABC transporter ATP-binding protein [Planctomycetaceae bacterium]|nr:ABC transporter ATP-binding protein [Planctomycetaceae bacterium]
MIRVENVTKAYQRGTVEVPVLRGLSCEIEAGSFTFIVGPSGSGKSTLLYLIGALDEPTSGEIMLNDRNLSAMSGKERDRLRRDEIGFIFQSFNLLSNLDAVDNVLAPYLTQPNVAAGKRAEAVKLLQQVGLGERLDHRPSEMSGGEQQRVAIARALLKQPSLILADEPTGELDSENGSEVFRHLRSLHEELATTVIVVTHDQRYIEPDDRVLEIRDGTIADTPSKAGE